MSRHRNSCRDSANLALHAVQREGAEDATAENAVAVLSRALHAAGIVLPSLEVDGCVCGRFGGPVMVELGGVRASTALRLAEVIIRGTA